MPRLGQKTRDISAKSDRMKKFFRRELPTLLTNSRSMIAITAIPPPKPMVPILKKSASMDDRDSGSVGGPVCIVPGCRGFPLHETEL